MTMPEVPAYFGIPYQFEHSISVHPIGNEEMYLRHYSLIWVDVGSTHYEIHEYIAWCFRDYFGEEFGPLRGV